MYLGFENVSSQHLEVGFRAPLLTMLRMRPLCPPILDVGSGRGELLDLLAVAGEQEGVDSDEGMVALSRTKITTSLSDAVNHLEAFETACLGAIFCAQLVEHLTYRSCAQFSSSRRECCGLEGD